MRVGIGFDVHKFSSNRKLIIGGIEIPYDYGLDGHSDADVLIHSIMDSILGAIGLGDIGNLFPDSDLKYKDADSANLLTEVTQIMSESGYEIGNLDTVIIAQEPKLAPFIPEMKKKIAKLLNADESSIGIKATTTEKLGFIGMKEGIAAQAVVIIRRKNEY